MQAIDKFGDESLKKQVREMFGEGTTVIDPKTPICKLGKSALGVPTVTLSKELKKVMKQFTIGKDTESVIISENGFQCTVLPSVLLVLKAICLYRVTCNPTLCECLGTVMGELSGYFDTNCVSYRKTLFMNTSKSDKNVLLDYCRREVLSLLKEEGLDVGKVS